jgi:hypothetical protein
MKRIVYVELKRDSCSNSFVDDVKQPLGLRWDSDWRGATLCGLGRRGVELEMLQGGLVNPILRQTLAAWYDRVYGKAIAQ